MHKILIVEDEAAAAMHLKKYLESAGYHIVGQAFSGAQAVERARSLEPDLILMDIVLQGEMNGIEASEIIKSELNIPILFVSAYSDEAIITRAASTNPYGYILKPFQERQIKIAVEMAFSKIASDRQLHESREKYYQMLQNTNEGILVIQDGIAVTANRRSAELFGHSLDDIVSRPFLEYLHPDDREMVRDGLQNRLEGQAAPQAYSCRVTDGKGNMRWFELSFIAMQWEGKPAVLTLVIDITGRKLAFEESKKYRTHLEKLVAERTEMLVKTSKELQNEIESRRHRESRQEIAVEVLKISQSTHDLNEMIEKVVTLLKDWSRVEAVAFRPKDGDGNPGFTAGGVSRESTTAPKGPRARGGRDDRTGDTGKDRALGGIYNDIVSGRLDASKPFFTPFGSFWTNSTTEMAATAKDKGRLAESLNAWIGAGYESVGLIPLRSETTTYGLIQLNDSRKGQLTAELISLFERLAELIGDSIARKLSQEIVDESARKMNALFELSGDLVYVTSRDGHFVEINAAGEQLLGYTRQELLGLRLKDICRNHDDGKQFQSAIERSGSVTDYRLMLKKKDGTHVSCQITSHVIKDSDGNIKGFQGIIKESSETTRKAAPSPVRRDPVVGGGTGSESESDYTYQDIISRNPRIRAIFKALPQIATSDSTVLIEGRSGTGKELFARAIHNLSNRKRGPFVAINCAALPENLLESELFGYVKGAFTNAVHDKPGRFALADKGTILLDEIGELSPLLQVKLLRIIQERELEPLGGVKPVKVDVRVISSTNRTIAEEVRKGNFREDLFFRLNVVKIELPELSERKEDIPLLINHLLKKVSAKIGRKILDVSDDTAEFLMQYDYPGNVRELENIIESAAVLSEGTTITLEHIINKLSLGAPKSPAGEHAMIKDIATDAEKKLIQGTLARVDGDRGKAATLLNMDRSTLWRKMKKYGLL